jgi:hypothetical protein
LDEVRANSKSLQSALGKTWTKATKKHHQYVYDLESQMKNRLHHLEQQESKESKSNQPRTVEKAIEIEQETTEEPSAKHSSSPTIQEDVKFHYHGEDPWLLRHKIVGLQADKTIITRL